MIAADNVNNDKKIMGAPNVSGLFFNVPDKKFITLTIRTIYAEALIALMIGFFDIHVV